MRWFWIDRFTEFTSGQRATAVKTVSLSEEHVHDHLCGTSTMPNSLIIEGMAQTAGLLAGEHYGFQESVILAKVAKVRFHERATPGETLTYRAVLTTIDESGARAEVTSHLGERLQAEMEVLFAHADIDGEGAGGGLFDERDFATTLRALRMYEVGQTPEGEPIKMPRHLAVAEGSAVA
ncbi:MAG: beta-hydroxyacyl-ACP dehydratase [Planctomycetota bacterium]|nr:MAG: beta-hydroxyacyl-ACP dehydratase [Planctomycetota bacterium]REJ89092.1 MAG: beta-hydroxyacyl-ACP dehydratase [Planctomycetota bacterium]REK24650.1 MAG: beta-hydroxyacyl-ACP dehydratase [Planctomycetota bacterium]REK40149.1 MAG: beta-hydroxyacyl-ACP dehydratase [Planctomycetota bacterium]